MNPRGYTAGRGNSRGNRFRGRGRGPFNERRSHDSKPGDRTKEYKFTLHRGKPIPGVNTSYASVKEHIELYIRRTFPEGGQMIADAIHDFKEPDFSALRPTLEKSTLTDKALAKDEDQVFRSILIDQIRVWNDDQKDYAKAKSRAYGLILQNYVDGGLKAKIEAQSDFTSRIQNNPIELMRTIRDLCHETDETKYGMMVVTDTLATTLNMRQQEDESITAYGKRMKDQRNVLKSQMGKNFLDTFIEYSPEYKALDGKPNQSALEQQMKDESLDKFFANLIIRNCDKTRYGTLVTGLSSQHALGNNQYPTTPEDAIRILENHKLDKSFFEKRKSKNEKVKSKPEETGETEKSFAQSGKQVRCYCCGSESHKLPTCPKKDKTQRNEWWDRTTLRNLSAVQTTASEETSINTSALMASGWSSVQTASLLNGPDVDLKNCIILDNASSMSIFSNPNKVMNIRKAKTNMMMETNAGNREVDEEAHVPGFGRVWFNEDAIANIFGLCDLTKSHRVTYDSDNGDVFVVTNRITGETVLFNKTSNGLYTCPFGEEYEKLISDKKDNNVQFLETVEGNLSGYSARQIERAKRARELYHILGTPSNDRFKAILRGNLIKNCPVTADDVNLAEKIYGPSISTLKGKTVRRTAPPVMDDYIEIPTELMSTNKNITICIDTMFINGCAMLTSIDTTVRYRSICNLKDKSEGEYKQAIRSIIKKYSSAGFNVVSVRCDGEYRNLLESIKHDLGTTLNVANPGDHVPEAERNNRTIEERFRATFHRLPYTAWPRIMTRYLALHIVDTLNMFPAKGGVSSYFSPYQLLEQRNIDYNKHCKYEFGTYVQAHSANIEKINNNEPRTLDAIYLRPFRSTQGGHDLMDLATGKRITRSRVTVIPITQRVIDRVNEIGLNEGFTRLQFKNRKGIIFPDADCTTGVDPEEDTHDDDDESIDLDDEGFLTQEGDEPIDLDDEGFEIVDRDELGEIMNDPDDDNETNNVEEIEDEIGDDVDDVEEEQDLNDDVEVVTRSGRISRPPERMNLLGVTFDRETLDKHHNLQSTNNPHNTVEYTTDRAMLIARTMYEISNKVTERGLIFGQQFLLPKGLSKFGNAGYDAAKKEMSQLHERGCFSPVDVSSLTPSEKKKAQVAFMFLTEKRDQSIKGRAVYNGKPTREWLSKEDAASPTAALESIFLTGTIEADEGRDVMTADIPNAFIQAPMPSGEEKIIMKITGVLVELLVEIDPEKYSGYVVLENTKKVLYVEVLQALYGMLQAALVWYKKFRSDLEEIGFIFNPYDPCVANRTVENSQHTVVFHVDDLKSSHINSRVNDEFLTWLQNKYGELKAVTATRGKEHEYLGMILDYSVEKKLKINMCKYVTNMINDAPMHIGINDKEKTPASNDLFKINQSTLLDNKRRQDFHTCVAKGLFLAKRARPDIQPTIAFLCTRVQEPTEEDWEKLERLLKYLNGTKSLVLTLSAENTRVIKWYVDASFAVHNDYKSHTGAIMTMGGGALQTMSRKQKLNTKSSTDAELVGVDDASVMILWTMLFMEAQGYPLKDNILYQDNKSAILLETNGRKSAGKRSRALNVRYFFIVDQVEKGHLTIEYCASDNMMADFMTKPLQGAKFRKFQQEIMGM